VVATAWARFAPTTWVTPATRRSADDMDAMEAVIDDEGVSWFGSQTTIMASLRGEFWISAKIGYKIFERYEQ